MFCVVWHPVHPVVHKALNSGGWGQRPQKLPTILINLGDRFVTLNHTKPRRAVVNGTERHRQRQRGNPCGLGW